MTPQAQQDQRQLADEIAEWEKYLRAMHQRRRRVWKRIEKAVEKQNATRKLIQVAICEVEKRKSALRKMGVQV